MNNTDKLRAKQLKHYLGRRIQFARGANKKTVYIGLAEAESIEKILGLASDGAESGNRGLTVPSLREAA